MRLVTVAAAAAFFISGTAYAADPPPPAQNGPENPAVHTDNNNNSNMPVAGANSFTRGQAEDRIRAKGFTHISHLYKDNKGVWRAKAQRDGKTVPVSVDFEGNVN